MNKVKQVVEQEPVVVIVGAAIALIEAILLALPLFGVDISAAQIAALMGIVAAAGALGIVLARQRVTPVAKVKRGEALEVVEETGFLNGRHE